MTVQTFSQPDSSSQTGTGYKTPIDRSIAVLAEVARAFAPHEAASPALTMVVDAGRMVVGGALVSQTAQTVSGFTATGANQRIDRVVLDALTGAATRVAGAESASPVAPAIPVGKLPCAQVGPFGTGTTLVTNSMITDERAFLMPRVGKQTLWIPAGAMLPRVSNGALSINVQETATNKVNVRYLEFTNGVDLFAQFNAKMPKSWDKGTITARFYWYATAGTGNVTWGLQAVAFQNASALDTAFGTIQTVTPTLGTVNQLQVTADTAAITIGNSPAGEDWVEFQVKRSGTTDSLAQPARLIGVQIILNTNAQDDS